MCNNSFDWLLQLSTPLKTRQKNIQKYTVLNWAKSFFWPDPVLSLMYTLFLKIINSTYFVK